MILYADIILDLDSLLIQLQDKVTQNWQKFGIALRIQKAVLDRCLMYTLEQSIIEILDHWLRSDVEHTWGEVARALKQINYHQLESVCNYLYVIQSVKSLHAYAARLLTFLMCM